MAPMTRWLALLSILGLAALLYAIIEGPVKGWSSTEVLAAAAVAVRYSCFPIRTCRVNANREPLALPAKLRHYSIRDAVSKCT